MASEISILLILMVQVNLPHTYGRVQDGSVRLVGGFSVMEGRVEVYHNGAWGSICEDYWSNADARVVCRMLGHPDDYNARSRHFGEGNGPIWFYEVQCDGYESSITQCRKNDWGWGRSCSPRRDAGVVCGECIKSPCNSHGYCTEHITGYTCSCLSGFTGSRCQSDINECNSKPCQNHGVCHNHFNGFTCACMNGYTEELCQTDIDECQNDPCQNNGTCRNNLNHFNCSCLPGFTDALCQTDIDECSGNPCHNNGSCIDGINQYQCTCLPGFTGTLCERDIDECQGDPCQNNGTCRDNVNHFSCSCLPGFTDELCQTDIDECSGNPCYNNGSCIDDINQFQCSCFPGFTGILCEQDIDECQSDPCQNNGTCINNVNHFNCSCLPGFTGALCQTDIDDCSGNPCHNNGSCIDDINQFQCACLPGFTGTLCEQDIDECQSDPCQNNGKCRNNINHFICSCLPGFTGALCQTDIDDCSGNPCHNNGSCIDDINQFQCACLPGFTGTLCERDIDECQSDPCQNNGTCRNNINHFNCSCLAGFTDALCQTDIDDCSGNPCLNNGSCIDGINQFQCGCLPGFTDTLCERDIDDCSVSPCHNNGSCIDGINQFQCACLPGFTGTICELDIVASTHYCDKHVHEQNTHSDCGHDIQNIKFSVDSLLQGNLSEVEVQHTIDKTLDSLQEFSLNTEHSPADLDNSIDLLDKIIDVSQSSNVSLPKAVVVTTIDNLLAENHTTAWKDTSKNKENGRVSKILKTVDKFGLHILKTVKQNESITFNSTRNMILTVANIPADTDVVFPNKDNKSSSLELPAQLHSSTQSIPYLAVKYKTIGNIMNGNTRNNKSSKYKVVSDILSLTLKTALHKEILNPPLQLKMFKENLPNSVSECAFWDFDSNNGDGGWSTEGCKMQSKSDLYTQCECNHLTNFAILVRPYIKLQEDEEALNWISVIGCSISIIFSLLTAITYLFFWKSITSDISRMIDKITILLCLSIAASYAVFLGGIDKTQYKVGCTVIAAVLQCLFLIIFFLMLALGMYYFLSVSLVKISFSKATKFKSDANIFSKIMWGIIIVMPALITAVTFGLIYSSGKDYHTKNSCWLSFESGALYGFIGPVALIILINILIVISLCVTLCSSKIVSNSTAKKRALSGIKSISILLPVLGVTWVFGFLSISDDVIVFEYIFAILNSFQGLFIFISKCLLNKKIRKAFIRKLYRKKTENTQSKRSTFRSSDTRSSYVKDFSSESKVQMKENECISEDIVQESAFNLNENTYL